jgi:hypothetical protein
MGGNGLPALFVLRLGVFSICCLLYPYFSYLKSAILLLLGFLGLVARLLEYCCCIYLLPEQGKIDLMSHVIFPFLFDSFCSEIEWGRQMIEQIPFVFPAYFTTYLFNSLGKLILSPLLFGDWQP